MPLLRIAIGTSATEGVFVVAVLVVCDLEVFPWSSFSLHLTETHSLSFCEKRSNFN